MLYTISAAFRCFRNKVTFSCFLPLDYLPQSDWTKATCVLEGLSRTTYSLKLCEYRVNKKRAVFAVCSLSLTVHSFNMAATPAAPAAGQDGKTNLVCFLCLAWTYAENYNNLLKYAIVYHHGVIFC